jgi:Fic family protein
MKLPEKPINWKEVLNKESDSTFKLVRDVEMFKKIIDFNKRYLYWTELKYRIPEGAEIKYIWTIMKLLRSEKHESVIFNGLDLKYISLPETNRKLHRSDKYLAGNIEVRSRSLGLEKRYIISSLMEEAIASSMIEGAATTRKVAKDMLKKKRKPRTNDEKMIVNNYETMQMILERKEKMLTPEFLLEIQRRITKGTLEDDGDEGKFRDNDNIVVGDSTNPEIICHIPPKQSKINDLIRDLCDFANEDSGDFIHPIIKGIILHFLVGYIHPFNDGNGRTARSVFYWYVLSQGYWLFEYMAISRRIVRSRKNYDLAYLYTENDELDLTYFINYLMTCIDDSLDDLLEYLERKHTEQQDTKKLLDKINDLNFRQASILEEIMKEPNKYFAIREISGTYHIVYQTARSDLLYLTKKGYLTKKIMSRTFVFSFEEENKIKLNNIQSKSKN